MDADREICNIDCAGEASDCKEKTCRLDMEIGYNLEVSNMDSSMKKSLIEAMEKQMGNSLFLIKLAILGNEHAIIFSEWMNEVLSPEIYSVNADLYKALESAEEDLEF